MNKLFSILNLDRTYINGNMKIITLDKIINILNLFSLDNTLLIVDTSSFDITFIKNKRIKYIILQDSILIYLLNKDDLFNCIKRINLEETEIFIYIFNSNVGFNNIQDNINHLYELTIANFDLSFYEGTFYIDLYKDKGCKKLKKQIKYILKNK